jgi:sulfatase modifying factor 1
MLRILPTVVASIVFSFGAQLALVPSGSAAEPGEISSRTAKKPASAKATRKAQLGASPASRGRGTPLEVLVASAMKEAATEMVPTAPVRTGMCPPNMAIIGRDYCVDIYEGSLVEMLADGSERPWSPYSLLTEGVKVRAVSQPGVFPQGYISGVQAKAACQASGKRLCKPEEWRKACMGPQKTTYPYGSSLETGRCNDNGVSPMLHYYHLTDKPEDSWKWGAGGNMLDPRLNQLPGGLAKTGDHPNCTNEFGIYDMVGNLHEWVDDPYGTFQGGYYLDTHLNNDGCYYETTAHDMKHIDYSTGFRCCADLAE